ncbi:rhodanese-like domain-containing protein [Facklamia miroungae]|uniref:Rhodanese-related sulfurtransferase n=1 Tax=Facklamia miroungae TaxID=120956 RepID=A0A1G7STZ7_9LACT|nr:rhodanese-like domain-containing protein [Facklamia miroungae]NKZ29539.1 rhodanese-like domain-containing protein [Facklamia miroungae]SDG26438.1 Rhodanese-related sulfurtransferase [Facklamia miroungae]
MEATISIQELYQKTQEGPLNIIDVRSKEEYGEGHIPGSKNLPLNELPKKYTTLSPHEDYYLVCHSSGRSKRAYQFLSKMNYNVTYATTGVPSWPGSLATD